MQDIAFNVCKRFFGTTLSQGFCLSSLNLPVVFSSFELGEQIPVKRARDRGRGRKEGKTVHDDDEENEPNLQEASNR